MIDYLNGTIASRRPTACVVDVGGVGYEVLIPMSTFEHVPKEGGRCKLYIHHHVREDAELLFGFASTEERDVFRTLVGVSGVGPKIGLAALSALRPEELRRCVSTGDVALLTRIPGVGRKTAERMIVELRDRLAPVDGTLARSSGITGGAPSIRADAVVALETLGLSRSIAEKQVSAVLNGDTEIETVEELIRLALRER